MTRARVVGLGLCVLDHIHRVEDLRLSEVRTRYRESRRLAGGMVATACAAAAQLGCETHLVSCVGDDSDGRFVTAQLRALGVNTRRVRRSDRHPTTHAIVLVDVATGERRFVVPDRRAVEGAAPELDLSPLRDAAVLLIDGHFPRQALRAARRARETGVRVVADLRDARPAYLRLLRHVDHAILPLEFARRWGQGGPRATLRELERRFGGQPAITLGARGALALDRGRFLEIPARRVKVKDTTGAGDVFHGAFAAGLARGRGFAGALRLAARAASLSCTELGGSGRLLRVDEL